MKNERIKIHQENNSCYLVEDIKGLSPYEKVKEIERFIARETKTLERYIDIFIKALIKRYGIIVVDDTKSVLKSQFSILKSKGIEIQVNDLYKNDSYYGCTYQGTSNNYMRVFLEDNRYLQCGIEVIERKIYAE